MLLLACDCHAAGATTCERVNGTCNCTNGYTGDTCNQCKDGFYDSNHGFMDEICIGILDLMDKFFRNNCSLLIYWFLYRMWMQWNWNYVNYWVCYFGLW